MFSLARDRTEIGNGFVKLKIMQYFVDTRLLICLNYFADSPPHFAFLVLLFVNLIYYSYSWLFILFSDGSAKF